jgi:hypothetical protein
MEEIKINEEMYKTIDNWSKILEHNNQVISLAGKNSKYVKTALAYFIVTNYPETKGQKWYFDHANKVIKPLDREMPEPKHPEVYTAKEILGILIGFCDEISGDSETVLGEKLNTFVQAIRDWSTLVHNEL